MSEARSVTAEFLARPAAEVAPDLLDKLLVSTVGDVSVVARIIEVEAYDQDDPASHTFSGPTPRNAVMFGPAGRLYVYLSYGIHRCANVVVGDTGRGEAVLLRAVEVVAGHDTVRARRGPAPSTRDLTNGPGKLCQALGIELEHDGLDVSDPSSVISLRDDGTPPPVRPLVGPRVGISRGVDTPWRFRR